MGDAWRIDKPTPDPAFCEVCQGHGFHKNPNDTRHDFWGCLACDGRCWVGVFVVQLVGRGLFDREVYDELSREWDRFAAAKRFAGGLAAVKEGARLRVGPPAVRPRVAAVRVVFKQPGSPDAEVYRASVRPTARAAARPVEAAA